MRWDDFRRSDNVEDDREGGGGGGFRIPGGTGGGLGIGTIVVLGLIGWALGIDPSVLIGGAEILSGGGGGTITQQSEPSRPVQTGKPTDQTGDFVAARARRHRGSLERNVRRQRQDLSPAQAAAVQWRGAGRLRAGADGDGAVLLPARSAHLSRHFVLQRYADEVSRLRQQQRLPLLRSLRDCA